MFQFRSTTAARKGRGLRFGWTIGIVSLLLVTFSAQARNWYVDNTASGANNGTSWADAWQSLFSISGVYPGDTVYISGGSTSQTYVVGSWEPQGGITGNPVYYRVGVDAGHNGIVDFIPDPSKAQNGNTNWLYPLDNNMHDVDLSGNVGGQNHMVVEGYTAATVLDGGATNVSVRYVTSHNVFRAYNVSGVEFDHLILGPNNGIDRQILGPQNSVANYKLNSIHDCTIYAYYQHGVNSMGGDGDDFIGNAGSCYIYHNNFIGIYAGLGNSYTYGQHMDGIQSGWSYVWVDSNYFENCANSCIYADMRGGGDHWIITNNVCNYTDSALAPNGCIVFGDSTGVGLISSMVIANNTCYGSVNGIGDASANRFSNLQIINNLCVNTSGIYLFGNNGDNTTGVTMLCNKCIGGTINPQNTQAPANNNPPTFVKPGAFYPLANYRLAPTDTGAVANGTNTLASVFNYDRDGNRRPAGSWSLGAYEYRRGSRAVTPNNLHVVPGS